MIRRVLAPTIAFAIGLSGMAQADEGGMAFQKARPNDGPSIMFDLPNGTQGPFWPPSELVDANGDFVVVGLLLVEDETGIHPVPGSALVSKNTVPPLDDQGVEDFSNMLGAPYNIIRPLDLSPGSPDLNIEVYTLSAGPTIGDFGGRGPRIPGEGDSAYNLNMLPPTCPELFPTDDQAGTYKMAGYPLTKAPIWGTRGDQVVYDVHSGMAVPADVPEQDIDDRPYDRPVTLGEWLRARGRVKITLTQFDSQAGGYTHARFEMRFRRLMPNSIYTAWGVRASAFLGALPSPLGFPNVVVTNSRGRGRLEVELKNPFPDRNGPLGLDRVLGIGFAYHPDYMNWGACFGRIGAGVDINGAFNTFANGTQDITPFITVEPIDG